MEEDEVIEAQEESSTMQKPKWEQVLQDSIRAVLDEFDTIVPQNLPHGLPSVRQGH